jgi:histidinol dehydrogenase
MIAICTEGTDAFRGAIARLEGRGDADLARVEPQVRAIVDAVRAAGDRAVLDYTEQFDKRRPEKLVRVPFDKAEGAAALDRLPKEVARALTLAAERIRAFHEHEREPGFRYTDGGVSLGIRVSPLARAAVYAPGGKARYPSSVLMSAIPAAVAGVRDIVLASPLSGDASDDAIFAAAHLSGVTTVVDAGGAQAIAALAYGTESIPRVDKIVGPGNIYVACAKRMVSGVCGIDSIAGPSEILVVADKTADPRVVAADLLSQAEHDEVAYPLLIADSEEFASKVATEIELQLATLPRVAIATAAVIANGYALVVPDRARAAEYASRIAAEHLSLQVERPEEMLAHIPRAGAAFIGHATPEAAGDYLAGPSHVLPTGGAVRFGSPLGVYDFVTRTSLLAYGPEALAAHAPAICAFARHEGLEAHARAVEVRTRKGEK